MYRIKKLIIVTIMSATIGAMEFQQDEYSLVDQVDRERTFLIEGEICPGCEEKVEQIPCELCFKKQKDYFSTLIIKNGNYIVERNKLFKKFLAVSGKIHRLENKAYKICSNLSGTTPKKNKFKLKVIKEEKKFAAKLPKNKSKSTFMDFVAKFEEFK